MARIAFLGAGRMASAMVGGLLARGTAPADLVCLGGRGRSAAELAARTGIGLASSPEDLLARAEALVVAFKPQHLAAADSRLAALTEKKLVVSVLAGRRLAQLARAFPAARNLVRCMPNTAARIGAAVTGWCSLGPLAPADRATLDALLAALGSSVEVDESQMDAVTAVAGCGPAYVFEFAAALRDAGRAAGLEPAAAQKLAVETLAGAARLLIQVGAAPETLRDEVVTPHGATAAALRRLAEGRFRQALGEAVLAAKARAEEMARE